MKQFWNIFFEVFAVCVVVALIVWGSIRFPKCYCWYSDVNVEYVYEGDSVVNNYQLKRNVCSDSKRDSLSILYSTYTGYNNELVLFSVENFFKKGELLDEQITEHMLFYVPDKRFVVTNITSTLTKRNVFRKTPDDREKAKTYNLHE